MNWEEINWFLRINKYRVGAVGVTLVGFALSMHFAQQGLTASLRKGDT